MQEEVFSIDGVSIFAVRLTSSPKSAIEYWAWRYWWGWYLPLTYKCFSEWFFRRLLLVFRRTGWQPECPFQGGVSGFSFDLENLALFPFSAFRLGKDRPCKVEHPTLSVRMTYCIPSEAVYIGVVHILDPHKLMFELSHHLRTKRKQTIILPYYQEKFGQQTEPSMLTVMACGEGAIKVVNFRRPRTEIMHHQVSQRIFASACGLRLPPW